MTRIVLSAVLLLSASGCVFYVGDGDHGDLSHGDDPARAPQPGEGGGAVTTPRPRLPSEEGDAVDTDEDAPSADGPPLPRVAGLAQVGSERFVIQVVDGEDAGSCALTADPDALPPGPAEQVVVQLRARGGAFGCPEGEHAVVGGCDTAELSLGEACADVRRIDPDGRVRRAWAATGGTVRIIDFDGPDLSGGCDVALDLGFDDDVSVYVGFETPDPAWYDDDGAVCTTQLP